MRRKEAHTDGWNITQWRIVKSAPVALVLLALPLLLSEQPPVETVRAAIPEGEVIVFPPEPWNESLAYGVDDELLNGIPLEELLDANEPLVALGAPEGGRFVGLSPPGEFIESEELIHVPSFFDDVLGPPLTHGRELFSLSAIQPDGLFSARHRERTSFLQQNMLTAEPEEWGYLLPVASRPQDRTTSSSIRLVMPPIYTQALGSMFADQVISGIDYSDPSGLGVPLLRISGYENLQISPHFKVLHFATRDGAPLARISPVLVSGLERVYELAGPIEIISGYRHRRHNARVGGAAQSRHIAGQAADIWSPTRSSIYLARQVIAAMGCKIGLGLGRRSVHVDVRGTLATWTYPGAPLSDLAFDLWIRMLCSGNTFSLNQLAARINWMESDSLGLELFEYGRHDPDAWFRTLHPQLAEFAAASWYQYGPGALIIDLSNGIPPTEAGIGGVVRYVRIRSEEITRYGLYNLVDRVSNQNPRRYFVYVMLLDDGSAQPGLANLEPEVFEEEAALNQHINEQQPAISSYAEPENHVQTEVPGPESLENQPGWVIVVASTASATEAEREAARYGRMLASAGLEIRTRIDSSEGSTRYRVTTGFYRTAEDARRIMEQFSRLLPNDAWLLPVDQ